MDRFQFHYEINLISDTDGEIIDLQYCCFIRAPLYHTCSYCIAKCFIPQLLLRKYTELISLNQFPKLKLKIYFLDESSQMSERKINIIYNQTVQCISIHPEKAARYTENDIHVKMVLVNPMLHYMGTTNTYNTLLENVTGYDALENFEEWIQENYGNIFDFQHYGVSENLNEYTYEHILVKTSNDLNVPNYLIDTYKINNSPTIYFFDNFNIDERTKNDIACLYLNLSKLESQFGENTSKFPDMEMLTKVIKKIPIKDAFKKYDKSGQVFNFRSKNIKYNHKKVTESNIPNKKSEINEINLDSERKINVSNDGPISNQQIQQSSYFSSVYVPDDFKNAELRFNETKDQFVNRLNSIVYIEVTSSVPDYPNFGKKYDIEKSGGFNFTPLSICNIFVRKNDKEPYMTLINKAVMVQFRQEEEN